MKLSVVYEDSHLLALDKPAGLHSAPNAQKGAAPTMLDYVLKEHPALREVAGWHPWEPAILHRLDFATSGLLLFAKTNDAFRAMCELLGAEKVQKSYLAITERESEEDHLPPQIVSYFRPAGPKGAKVKVLYECQDGAHGHKCTLERYKSTFSLRQNKGPFNEVTIVIRRGFRHQIRAHLASCGYPIVGDELYNPLAAPSWANRLYLHAFALDFTHPFTGAPLHLETAAPWSFHRLIAALEEQNG